LKRALLFSKAFSRDLRSWLKSRPEAASSIEATLEQLADDAFAPSLRSHKLRGPLTGRWACSADYDVRIVFKFVEQDDEEAVLLLSLGTHDEVY
jgi:mRNA-degrading endonuclease YafQ of YafQ-DinJ toxin-antitoxin module